MRADAVVDDASTHRFDAKCVGDVVHHVRQLRVLGARTSCGDEASRHSATTAAHFDARTQHVQSGVRGDDCARRNSF